jgi:hypothetical protein
MLGLWRKHLYLLRWGREGREGGSEPLTPLSHTSTCQEGTGRRFEWGEVAESYLDPLNNTLPSHQQWAWCWSNAAARALLGAGAAAGVWPTLE